MSQSSCFVLVLLPDTTNTQNPGLEMSSSEGSSHAGSGCHLGFDTMAYVAELYL